MHRSKILFNRVTKNNMRFNVIIALMTLLINGREANCAKDDDNKDFLSFINSFGDKKNKKNDHTLYEKLNGKSRQKEEEKEEIDLTEFLSKGTSTMKSFVDSGHPGQIGFGFMMGYSSGFCLKKVSRVVAMLVGGTFIGLQTLSYNGFISINYDKFQRDVEMEFDLNNDGVFDEKDLQMVYDKVYKVLSHNMPSGGGFLSGFLLGLRN